MLDGRLLFSENTAVFSEIYSLFLYETGFFLTFCRKEGLKIQKPADRHISKRKETKNDFST